MTTHTTSTPRRTGTPTRKTRLPRYSRMWLGYFCELEALRKKLGRPIAIAFITPEEAEARGLLEEPTIGDTLEASHKAGMSIEVARAAARKF